MPTKECVEIFTLTNSNNITVKITNYGGIILLLALPDKFGRIDDVTLGYEKLADYQQDTYFFGAVIGRYANRIENAEFKLNNYTYKLAKNDENNHLHGGHQGFNKVIWKPQLITDNEQTKLVLRYYSKDGEENYPGNLQVEVTYSLTEDNELCIDYSAVTDQDTIVNLTNHAYFNLAGHKQNNILNHQLKIYANYFTPINKEFIPTGEIYSVKNTSMDFRTLTTINSKLNNTDPQLVYGQGFDHNWVLNLDGQGKSLKKAAELYEPNSGRFMEVFTTKPGIQFYSGNFLKGPIKGKDNAVYYQHSGLCLETQYFPNSPNYNHFPSPVLKANEKYHHTTIYKFSIKS